METRDLMRRRPGQNGCCGCWLGAFLGLGALALPGLVALLHLVRRRLNG